MKSTKWTLTAMDFFRGLVIAVTAPIVPIILQSLSEGSFVFNFPIIRTVAIGAFAAYIAHKFPVDDIAAAQKTLADAQSKDIAVSLASR